MATRIRRLLCASLVAVFAACGSAPVGPGFYRVERGDTVSKIARENRTSVQNIVRWNGLANPDAIEVDQVLRVVPPAGMAAAPRPAPASSASRGDTAPDPAPAKAPAMSLVWPAQGEVIRTFDGKTSKGIDIVNAPGTKVVAAAGGTVVYAGNGLRGYGNMLIVKHDSEYLTAYAHNRALLVKEGQTVAQGQQIAEMGDTDSNRVMLHFELRYLGRSTDPSRYLPAR
ncbi:MULTISPECIES: peptidoglycan DD-metalloendopeptidase family protein [unclassified Caballeronia]|uniref:peptidoglycan DD-metalloendopeptidase family protein n=1 Tax=unclassified Caballeronia TaxID=2646786 RepID=UPI00285A1BFF|nr:MULTISPECIES: peptidoglycan DD-metalloendopeptidase family protein [unclassified Caballeronia]MDR5751096.1 peptidoglycan DD-metalloendopeptidase family protein [Caballeronia sp. LZ024]MDR5844767.1 peptidoglycan DD-metalloendopeptidase family protein [Caballeronia sp. LZ031]